MKRIIFISHSAITPFHLEKFIKMSHYFNILLITPSIGREEGVLYRVSSRRINNSLEHRSLKYFFPLKIYLSFSPSILMCILRFKPDLLFIDEEPMAFCSFFVMFLKRLFFSKIPSVVYSYENIRFPWLFKFPKYVFYNFFNKFVMSGVDGLLVPSDISWKLYDEYSCRKEIIPQYGISKGWLVNKKSVKNKDCFKIGFVGRLIEEKGILFLLNVIKKIDFPYEIKIVGEGYLKEGVKEFIEKEGIEGRVLGHVEHGSLKGFLKDCDCVVLPSFSIPTWKEQFGRVIVEALAVGTYVIASDSGAIPFVLGRYGYVFEEGNGKRLLELLNKLYYGELSIPLKERIDYVKNNFISEAVVRKTVAFLESIINEKKQNDKNSIKS